MSGLSCVVYIITSRDDSGSRTAGQLTLTLMIRYMGCCLSVIEEFSCCWS